MNEYVAFLAVFLACLARTTMPIWYKRKNGEDFEFQMRYIGTFISALIVSFMLAAFIYPMITLPDATMSEVLGFSTVFIAAWGMNDIANKLLVDAWKQT